MLLVLHIFKCFVMILATYGEYSFGLYDPNMDDDKKKSNSSFSPAPFAPNPMNSDIDLLKKLQTQIS